MGNAKTPCTHFQVCVGKKFSGLEAGGVKVPEFPYKLKNGCRASWRFHDTIRQKLISQKGDMSG
jgi:hypothetical protein